MLRITRVGTVWRHRDLRLMLPARAVSAFGDDMALIALTLRVYAEHLGPWSITCLLLCFAVPAVVLAPLAGRLVDSVGFRGLGIATGVWQAACCAGLAFTGSLWSTYALVLALQAGSAVALPAWQALIPSIAERDEIGPAVGLSQALNTVASVAAPAVAGVTVGSLGYAAPLLVDAGTFMVLAVVASAIRSTRGGDAATAGPAAPGRAYSLRSDPLLWPLLVGLCILVLVGEATNVVEIFLLRGTLGASVTAFGLVGAVIAAAVVVGSIASARPTADAARARRAIAAAGGLGLALVLAGLAPSLAVFVVAWAIVGVSNGMANVDVGTLVLGRPPEAYRGRVLARVNGMVRGSSLGAMALGGAAGTLLRPRETFVVGGGLMVVVAIALLLRTRRADAGLAIRPI